MKEVVANFGRNGNLQGIVCMPEQPAKDYMLVLVNAGVTQKSGPFRLNVDIARHVAAKNIQSLRFDYGGLGDSEKFQSALSHVDAIMQDITDAFDYLQTKYGIKRFVVAGLCTGAEHSYKIALRDERVIGTIWLDGYGYATQKFKYYRYMPVLVSPKRLLNFLLRMFCIKRLLGLNKRRETNSMMAGRNVDDFVWKQPPKNRFIDEMTRLFKRQVRFLYVYSGGVFEYYNYAEQFADAFGDQPFMQAVKVVYFPQANHTYAIQKDKQQLLDTLTSWLTHLASGKA